MDDFSIRDNSIKSVKESVFFEFTALSVIIKNFAYENILIWFKNVA